VLGINVMHDAIEGGGLAPALVSPVASAIGKHAGEVTHGRNTGPRKGGPAVGVSPTVATVG
jgi:hypothetical protein